MTATKIARFFVITKLLLDLQRVSQNTSNNASNIYITLPIIFLYIIFCRRKNRAKAIKINFFSRGASAQKLLQIFYTSVNILYKNKYKNFGKKNCKSVSRPKKFVQKFLYKNSSQMTSSQITSSQITTKPKKFVQKLLYKNSSQMSLLYGNFYKSFCTKKFVQIFKPNDLKPNVTLRKNS